MRSAEKIYRRFIAGEMRPFYDRYYPGLLMYARRVLGSELEWMAEDCVQDSVMDAFQKRDTFESMEQWRAHMLACIRNKAVSALRRLSAMRNYTGQLDTSACEADAHRAIIELETLDALYEAIESLPAEYRTLLRLSFEEGLKNVEIAQRLGVAEITVKKRKARLLEMLRQRLGGNTEMIILLLVMNKHIVLTAC